MFINEHLLKQEKHQYLFRKCFLIICWNLMTRAHNVFSIDFAHMSWAEDALCIYFAHMKNDQCGERPRDPRHVYANPLVPSVCPILALGLYWVSNQVAVDNSRLFPGKDQYDRF